MLIVVDPHSGVPVYKQLMDQVKFHVASGLLKSGDELPSTRALSAELGVNPMTISKAYSYLEKEGVVERRPGRPLVVKELESERAAHKKIDQLRESFTPVVTMVRQLGIRNDQAIEVLEKMLRAEGDSIGEETGTDNTPDTPSHSGGPRSEEPQAKDLSGGKADVDQANGAKANGNESTAGHAHGDYSSDDATAGDQATAEENAAGDQEEEWQ